MNHKKEFRRNLYCENRVEIERYLMNTNINTSENELGCHYSNYGYEYHHNHNGHSHISMENPDNQHDHHSWYIKDEQGTHGVFIPWTPLQYVCAVGKENILSFLLERGANPLLKDKTGRNSLQIAQYLHGNRRKSFTEMLETWIQNLHFHSKLYEAISPKMEPIRIQRFYSIFSSIALKYHFL